MWTRYPRGESFFDSSESRTLLYTDGAVGKLSATFELVRSLPQHFVLFPGLLRICRSHGLSCRPVLGERICTRQSACVCGVLDESS